VFFYRCEYPSTQADLNVYGQYFSSYLEKLITTNRELSDFGYLGELAELEWHWYKSYFVNNDLLFALTHEINK